MRLAVFASGEGTNLEAISKMLPVELVFSDNPNAPALERVPRAKRVTFAPRDFPTRLDYEQALVEMVTENSIDLVALAGYMRIVGQPLLHSMPGRITNIHPSLLPAFPGKDAIRRAWEAGVEQTGVTVHFVDEGIDTGTIIAQQSVCAQGELAEVEARVHQAEHQLYPAVLAELMEGKR